MKTIDFDRAKLQELRNAYTNAVARGEDQFEFEGSPILVAYAKYLIEYLDSRFKSVRDFPLESLNEHQERA